MAAVKWIFVVLFGLGSAGALAMALTSGGADRQPSPRTAPPLALREFPSMSGGLASARVPAAPDVAKTPELVAKTPEPVAKTPPPVAKPPEPVAAVPRAPPAEGLINLRASDTADVYLDGKKLGGSPLLGIKARVGNHKVRFDCYDAAGNTVAGPQQTITVKADAEVDLEYPCRVE